MNTVTSDTFFNGRICIKQFENGYRFSLDAVILAGDIRPAVSDTLLDLGTGCGIIPIILAYRFPDIDVIGVEVQKDLADLAKQNVTCNSLNHRILIRSMDMNSVTLRHVDQPVDIITSNPPYRRANSGRINPEPQKAVARHELRITLSQLVASARRLLRTGGKFHAIYPADRMVDLISALRACNMEPKFLRSVHSKSGSAAKLVLVEAVKAGRPGITIKPPLIIYKKDDIYSDEMERMFHP
ncbi:MAG: methyltransferase [Desulfobacteraceae bacterium]|nr:methyltransferase [Desulfobacteraceae bacterium]